MRLIMTDEILDQIKQELGLSEIDEALPIIQSCIDARDKILSEDTIDLDYKMGSLVLDTRDGEIGFIIGPLDIVERKSKLTSSLEKINKKTTFLIVTRSRESYSGDDLGLVSTPPNQKFRVRYVKREFLVPLKIEEPKDTVSDLDTFCNSQCIMECTSECKLYKYRKKK